MLIPSFILNYDCMYIQLYLAKSNLGASLVVMIEPAADGLVHLGRVRQLLVQSLAADLRRSYQVANIVHNAGSKKKLFSRYRKHANYV